jgi:hypothetical protein
VADARPQLDSYAVGAFPQVPRACGSLSARAGAKITSVAAGLGGSGKVYALITAKKTRTYSSDDGGLHWTEQASPTNCPWPYSSKLQVRADGNVFLDCGGPILRSRDGTRSWTPFTPATLTGQLAFDPASTHGAAVRNRGAGFTPNDVPYTADDGLNWLRPANSRRSHSWANCVRRHATWQDDRRRD